MATDVALTVVIERGIDDVATYTGDPTNAPAWQRRVESAEWQTAPPVRLGSQALLRLSFLGREVEQTIEVVELTVGEQVAMRTVDGPFPVRTTYTWRPVGDRVTHMVWRNRLEPTGFRAVLAPFAAIVVRRWMTADLAALKHLLER